MAAIEIANRRIGADHPTFVVAEMSCNHRQRLDTAIAILRAAKEAGADAVKIQAYDASSMTLNCDAEPFQMRSGPWAGRTLWDLYSEGATPWEWLPSLKAEADRIGIILFPSVFAEKDIPRLLPYDFPVWKIASFEVTSTNLIRAVARTGKPILLSTGMATGDELHSAMLAVWGDELGNFMPPIVALLCTTAYPAPVSAANLETLGDLEFRFGIIGLSDHSRNNSLASAAVALGARVVERHLTLRRSDGGPDAPFSDEPHEFAAMVRAIRDTEAALGQVHYGPTESEMGMLRFRRSLWVTRDIPAGDTLTPDNIAVLRPEGGLPPCEWESVLGRKASQALPRGTALRREHVEA